MANFFSGLWNAAKVPFDDMRLLGKVVTGKTSLKDSFGEHQRNMNDVTVPILGNNKVANKKAFIVVPPEISIDNQLIDINLNSNEMSTQVVNITPKVQPDNTVSTGIFNILIICNDIIKTEEVIVL